MTVTVKINGLRLGAIIGTRPEERRSRQDVVIDVSMRLTRPDAAAGDDMSETVDYDALCRTIAECVETSRFALLERLAGEIMSIVIAQPAVESATVEVAKPAALDQAGSASVVCTAGRGDQTP